QWPEARQSRLDRRRPALRPDLLALSHRQLAHPCKCTRHAAADLAQQRQRKIRREGSMRPRRRSNPVGLNAVGKPYSASFDPNYRLRFDATKVGRLFAPYGPNMRFVGDNQPTEHKRRRRQPQPAPLLLETL